MIAAWVQVLVRVHYPQARLPQHLNRDHEPTLNGRSKKTASFKDTFIVYVNGSNVAFGGAKRNKFHLDRLGLCFLLDPNRFHYRQWHL